MIISYIADLAAAKRVEKARCGNIVNLPFD